MKKLQLVILFLYLILFCEKLHSQDLVNGPASIGQGGAYTTGTDLWSALNNQSSLADFDKTTIGVGYENRFLIKELSTKFAGAAIPVSRGVFGISVSQFGYSLYNRTKFGLAYSMKMSENINAGIKIDYFHLNIGDIYGNAGTLTFEGGFNYTLSEKWLIGFHCFNPVMSKLADYNNERLTTFVRVGARFFASPIVSFTTEIEKDISYKPSMKFGIDYKIAEYLFFRSGISTKPTTFAFGFGIVLNSFILDFSSSYHEVLGFSPSTGIIYSF